MMFSPTTIARVNHGLIPEPIPAPEPEAPYTYCGDCGEVIELDQAGQCEPCWMREHPRAVSR